jgi:hypothetical protein
MRRRVALQRDARRITNLPSSSKNWQNGKTRIGSLYKVRRRFELPHPKQLIYQT